MTFLRLHLKINKNSKIISFKQKFIADELQNSSAIFLLYFLIVIVGYLFISFFAIKSIEIKIPIPSSAIIMTFFITLSP